MIDILLSTYNGERFLNKQLDSIINQTYTDWRLIIRDDNSTDNTPIIIKTYTQKYPNKILLVDENSPNLGVTKSFERLLTFVQNEYFMFADQDDIWLATKIQKSLLEIKKLEERYGKIIPLLVCCDAKCIDSAGNLICDSFFLSQKFIDTTNDATNLLALNVVQGSTTLMNKIVINYISPIPHYVLYDQWIAVITAHYGKVHYIHNQLMLYRQHEKNVLGAINVNYKYFLYKIKNAKNQIRLYYSFYKNLPFRPNIGKWIIKKIIFSIQRL